MITRQYDVSQSVINYMINNLIDLSDSEIIREFTKASQGAKLQKVGSQFIITF
ncbi:MAG TPA: hypothetical protein VGB37_08585 [Candidatus Lokiarchaeia archaeon]